MKNEKHEFVLTNVANKIKELDKQDELTKYHVASGTYVFSLCDLCELSGYSYNKLYHAMQLDAKSSRKITERLRLFAELFDSDFKLIEFNKNRKKSPQFTFMKPSEDPTLSFNALQTHLMKLHLEVKQELEVMERRRKILNWFTVAYLVVVVIYLLFLTLK